MKVNGTLVNYYIHCKRQCYLHGNRINMESNSEDVKIGKAIHKIKEEHSKNTEVAIENIKIDKITKEYLVEVKKSDADIEAVRWQVLFYLKVLKDKGINKKGKIEVVEKKKGTNKIIYEELTDEKEEQLKNIISDIEKLIESENPPKVEFDNKCKKCAYYEYCYI
ncbi:CRISPR-associated protein Cas4 [Clostridium novyi]|uniref:CRISPR-associated exonuclease Cas4 n=1 Tax=Clostridium novyi (strain NT) TaxID=386415 RepID=A0Q253_CLONN|nr:CRISPR-associated protein Cas4 [Clostridium novyi]ABK62333.1 CRISPR-associated protein Cas4 [Clostridium novyi NT]KEH86223.1 CRISPR-associated protein Cas4 [Clostridium novyi A str. NCTC 538]